MTSESVEGGGRRCLLAIDGGGVRGIMPVSALVELERVTGRLTRETFSFVAGTSAGAVIAAGVAAGIPATRILDLYVARAREVFTRSLLNLPRRILLGSMYSTKKLHGLLAGDLGLARDWTLNDAPIDLLITAKRVADGKPWYFVRDNPANAGEVGGLKLADCVTASAAAPTYFTPWTVPTIGALVDGSVGVAGNPVYQACVEAFFYHDAYTPEQTAVISLGTGRFPSAARPTWIGSWLEWLLRELLRSPGEQQTELVQRHFPTTRFHRLDPVLEQDIGLDDVDKLDLLREYGRRFAAAIDWPAILAGGEGSSHTRVRVT